MSGEAADPRRPNPDLRQLIRGAAAVLTEAGIGSPEQDAATLAAHLLGVGRAGLATAPPPDGDFAARYAALVQRRHSREPLQHIVGEVGFRQLTLRTPPGVFVPRPETELVAQVAVEEADALAAAGRTPVVVDLCCGGGAVALAVATEVPSAQVTAVDLAPAAAALARANATFCGAVLRIVQADATDPRTLAELDGSVDVIVANPPYIPPGAEPIEPEVRDHDPELALYGGGPDGLAVPRGVVVTAARLLRAGGLLVMEHAENQAEAVLSLVSEAFTGAHTRRDLAGRDRMVVARRAARPQPDLQAWQTRPS